MGKTFHAVALSLMLSGALAVNAGTFAVNGINYNTISGNTVEVTTSDPAYEGEITIPETVENGGTTYTVVKIGEAAFASSSITAITMPQTITEMGAQAFYNASNLVSVVIPPKVIDIPSDCFYNCSSLSSCELPEGLSSINSYGLCSTALKTLKLPSTLKVLGEYSLAFQPYLKEITLPASLSDYGSSALAMCSALQSINVDPENISMTSYNGALFNKNQTVLMQYPGGKTTFDLPATVTTLDYKSCEGTNFSEFVAPSGLQTIASECFYRSALSKVTLNEGLTTLGEYAFHECTSLTSLNIPASVTTIGSIFGCSLVYGCSSLAVLTVDAGNKDYCAEGNVLYDKDKNVVYGAAPALTEINLPETVTSIIGEAFYGCKNVKSLVLPNSLLEIGKYACRGMSGLTSLTFGTGLKAINKGYAFMGCNQLTSLTFPDNIETLGNYEFSGCKKLDKIEFGKGMKKMGSNTFNGANLITSITVNALTPPTIQANTFTATAYANAQVSVPAPSMENYKAATGWSKFVNYEPITTADNSVEVEYTGKDKIALEEGAVIPVLIKNTGTNEVTSIEYTVNIDGQEGEYSFDDISIQPYQSMPYEFPASMLPVGTHSIVVDVATVNGEANASPNKKLSFSLEIYQAVELPDDAAPATYTNFEYVTNYGGASNPHLDVATLVAEPALAGKKVLGMKIQGITTQGLSNVSLWYSSNLNLNGTSFTPDGESMAVTLEDDMATAVFTTPAVLTEKGVYFGISLDNDMSGYKWPVTQYGSDMEVKEGFMFHTGTRSYFSDYSSDGVLGVTLYLEGGITAPGKVLVTDVKGIPASMPGHGIELTGVYQNFSGQKLNSFELTTTVNGTANRKTVTLSEPVSEYLLQPHAFKFDLPSVANAGTYPVDLAMSKANGTANPDADKPYAFDYYIGQFQTTHRPMFEEFTGTGCGYCPRGTLGMNEMAKAYPDFIGVAYHGYNSGDPMFINGIPGIFSGSAPAGILERQSGEIDPYYGTGNSAMAIKTDFEAARRILAPADMGLEASLNPDNTVTATASMNFSYVDNGYTMAFVLSIDSLCHSEAAWEQANYYEGESSSDPLINSLGNGTYDLTTFNHVVIDCSRAVNSNHWAKNELELGKNYSVTNSFDLAKTSLADDEWLLKEDLSKVNVVAFLIDDYGRVRNAVKVRVGQKLDNPTGVSSIDADSHAPAAYYDLMGRRVANPDNGIFIRLQNGQASKVAL